MKQHCRDHDYVTLKDAAAEKLNSLQDEMKKCDAKRGECQEAIQKAQTVASELASAANDRQQLYEKVKTDFMQQVEKFFANNKEEVSTLQSTRTEQLVQAEKNLRVKMEQLQNVRKQGQQLTESKSHYDIVANYDPVMTSLQQVNQVKVDEIDAKLVDMPKTVLYYKCVNTDLYLTFVNHVLGLQWKQTGQFKVNTDDSPTGIAVTSDSKIAVCDSHYKIVVYSKSGDVIHTFPTDDGWLGGLGEVSITSTNAYIIPKYKDFCWIFDHEYKQISKFQTYNAKKELSEAKTVAVDKNGCIVLGMKDNAISIHNADGSLKSSFPLPYEPCSVAVTSHEEIVVTSHGNAQLFEYSGKCIQTLDPPPEINTWKPYGVCCSKTDEVFVVNRGDPKAIYKYAVGRVYMGCVTTEVNDPWGIALSHDDQEMYVSERSDKMVKIFQRP